MREGMGCGGGKQPSQPAKASTGPNKPVKGGDGKPQNKEVEVMGKYRMLMGKEDTMGEGTSSICRKGYEIKTGRKVAIKVYKDANKGGHSSSKTKAAVTLQKFKRQIQVLKQLQEPFKKPAEPELWCKELEEISPDMIFMILIDHSVDKSGEPGPDVGDGTMYVVTELAQYSLKDWISSNREKKKPVDKETIRNLSKAIVVAMAGLHAKGYVHLDMKPENLMMFNGKLKVIDVDGCVRSGSKIAIQDSSISFSPCYCAPEWARFLISETDGFIKASPLLDCWSVGMTLAELVTFDAILKPTYAQFLRNAQSHREASFLFMEWLGSASKVHLPSEVQHFEKDLHDLLHVLLLVGASTRKSMAQCLSHRYLKAGTWVLDNHKKAMPQISQPRVERHRPEDQSTATPLHKGTLWKLNSNGDPKKADHWIKRDMWLAQNHSLCYYSVKENRRLVLVDAAKLAMSQVDPIEEGSAARENAFTIRVSEDKDGEAVTHKLAAESAEELSVWMTRLQAAQRMDMIVTLQLGADMANDLQAFRVNIRNRRMKVEEDKDNFQPAFRAKLWKLKGDGDRMKPEDWFERDMWIAKNGSLVYYSPKQQSELIYYTAADVARSRVAEIAEGEACRSWVFQVVMPAVDGVEFAPGEFAAETEELRKKWMEELTKCQQ